MTTTSEAVLKVEAALIERDKRIDRLEQDLRESRKPRNRMVLVGGPMEGDTVLVAPNPSSPYYIAVTPRRESAVRVSDDWMNPPMDFSVEQHFYRMQRVRTGDGDRLVGIYERTV